MTDKTADRYVDLLKKCLTASLYDESGWRVLHAEREPEENSLRRPGRLLRGVARRWAVRLCRKRSLMLVQRRPFRSDWRDEGRDWPCFGYTMVGHRRLENVQMCVEDVIRRNTPGDFVEAGVWRGGTTIFMRALLEVYGVTDRTVWVADSFEGLPTPASNQDGPDLSEVEYLKASLEDVRANFARFGLLDDQVRFLKGWFSETLSQAPIERIAILRLDGDLYSSTMDTLCGLYHRVSPGGYVIIDDYYSHSSALRAVHDFRQQRQIDAAIQPIDSAAVYWTVPERG